ncbi:MAG: glycosyltransferase, partial [Planctomycetales bacterium]|nr:glycosyltransferase [Planctomycetales bacterium]
LSFALSLSRNLFRREKYDVVMVYCPLMGGVVFAGIRKLLRRDPLWVNIQDNPADAAAASGMIRSGLLRRFASGVQKLILNRADVWSSISPDMVERLKRIQSKDVPIHLCSNWLTKSLRDSIDPIPSKVGRVMQQPIKLLYCGTIGKKQGLLQFCEALAKCDLAFDFQIRGAGGESESVRQWIQHRGDSRFQFGELVSHSEFIDAIAGADWFVVPQLSSAGGAFFPSKLIPAISIGTPILAVSENEGPLYREVSENKIGLVVPWSRIERLADELATFQDSPDAFFQLQTNCLKRSATYESSNAIAHFEQLLQQHAFGLRSGAGNPIAVTQSDGHVPSVKHS